MKIAVDGTTLWGEGRYSGVEKVVDRILHRLCLDPHNCELRILVPQDWSGFQEAVFPGDNPVPGPDRGLAGNVERLPFPGKQKLRRIFWQQAVFPAWLRRWGADRVFCPTYVMPLLSPCPAAVLVHDLHGLNMRRTRWENYLHYRLVLPATLHRAATVMTPTRAVLEEVRPYLPSSCKAFAVPWGVDEFFTPEALPGEQISRYILFVGNLERRKGLVLLLEAFAILRSAYPDLKLVLAGKDRGLFPELRRQAARLGMESGVQFTGFVSPDRLRELYRKAAVLALPSEAEGFGLTPLEAMACGTPVVAVDTGAVRENLGNAAVYSSATPTDLARTFQLVLDDTLLRQNLRLAGLERAAQFTWEQTMEGIWQGLLANGP